MKNSMDSTSAPSRSKSTIDSQNNQRAIIYNFFASERTFEGVKQDAYEFFSSETHTSVIIVKEVVEKLQNERKIVIQTQTLFDSEQRTSMDTTTFTPQNREEIESHSKKRMLEPVKKANHRQDPRKRFVSLNKADSFLQDTKETQSTREAFRQLFGLPKSPQKLCNDPLKGIQELLCGYSDRKMDALELLKEVRRGR